MGVIKKKTATKGTEGGLKYICDVCSVDITSTVRIHCANKDTCPDYDLCVPCFGQGLESKTHKAGLHNFHVIEQHSIPVYDEDWGADEELLLLEGAETYGIGSWADIADHIGGYRSKDEVREHYIKTYVEASNFPLPARADPNDMSLLEEMPREEFQSRKKRRIEDRKEAAKNAPPQQPKQKPTASVPACHEVQGYMPGRLEFETEFYNEAEEAVQHMQFEPGDGLNPRTGEMEPEMELKMAVMDIYNSKLTARAMRKRAIFEHRLLEYRKNAAIDKKRTKEERDLVQKCKPFARITNHDDWDALQAGLVDEHYYRLAIERLMDWRLKGISDMNTGIHFEGERATRLAKPVLAGAFDRMPGSRPPKPAPATELPPSLIGLIKSELPPNLTELEKPESARKLAEKKATQNGMTNGTSNAKDKVRDERQKYTPSPVQGVVALKLGPDTPDVQLLTKEEKDLCGVIRCTPKAYIAMKEAVMRESAKNGGGLKRKNVKEVCKIDAGKSSRLFEFMVRAGWIQKV